MFQAISDRLEIVVLLHITKIHKASLWLYDHDQNIQNCGRGLRKLGQRFPALFIEDQLRVHVRGLGPKFPSRSTVRTESERSVPTVVLVHPDDLQMLSLRTTQA